MPEHSRLRKEDVYSVELPQSILLRLGTSTHLTHGGEVSVVRRRADIHSEQVLSPFFESDAFFLNVWKALIRPDELVRESYETDSAGRTLRNSYYFFQRDFCKRHDIDVSGLPASVYLKEDIIQVILDVADKSFGSDASTITYFLTTNFDLNFRVDCCMKTEEALTSNGTSRAFL